MYFLRNLPPSPSWLLLEGQLSRTKALHAWQWTRGAASFPIAYLCDGVQLPAYPELRAAAITGYDVVANTPTVAPDLAGSGAYYPSTHGAMDLVGNGSAGSYWQPNDGAWGIAPDASLLVIKTDGATAASCAAGINKAVELGARVIITYFATGTDDAGLSAACANAWSAGALVVAAIGSDGAGLPAATAPRYPAYFPNVVCVSSTAMTDEESGVAHSDLMFGFMGVNATAYGWSPAYGPRVDIAAPAYTVFLTEDLKNTRRVFRGSPTMGPIRAAPQVAAVAHLIWASNPSLTNAQVRDILLNEADRSQRDWEFYGFFTKVGRVGIPDAEKSVLRSLSYAQPTTVFPYLRLHSTLDERATFNHRWTSHEPRNVIRYVPQPDGTSWLVKTHGPVAWEVGGYCNGVVADYVELWVNGVLQYSGAPTSPWSGNMPVRDEYRTGVYDLRVVARSGSTTVTRTYDTPLGSNPATAPLNSASYVATPSYVEGVVDGARVGGPERDTTKSSDPLRDGGAAGTVATDFGSLQAPVIASPANGSGYSAQAGSFPVQIQPVAPDSIPPGSVIEVWVNGAPYTTVLPDASGNATVVVSYPLGSDAAQAGDRASDTVMSAESTRAGSAAGTAAGAVVLGRETPSVGAQVGDSPFTSAPGSAESVQDGAAARDVATGFQQSAEVLRQKAAQGDVAGDVFTPGGAIAAPVMLAPAPGTDATGLAGLPVLAGGAPAGATVEFFVNGTLAGSVPADSAGLAQWYLPIPWGTDSAQAGDRATDVYTPAPKGTIVEAAQDGAGQGDFASDALSAKEAAQDGAAIGDRAPQDFGEAVTDGAQATDASVTSTAALRPLPDPLHAKPVPSFLESDRVRAFLAAKPVSPYLRCGMSDIVYQGADRDIQFKLPAKDADGNAIDYTGARLYCDAETSGGSPIPSDATALNAAALTGRARFTAATTANMTARASYGYDGFVKLTDGRVIPVGTGDFTVRDPVTPTPP